MKIFSKTLTETLPLKKPKNPKNNPETWYVNEKVFDNYDILYIVEKVLKSSQYYLKYCSHLTHLEV